ncbi:SagB-type dehydrogenase family enzyme [Pseudomonas corrugata]|uniref:SagB/ThcOx family dehydrogenase n=1 Tax=Pseudomonas corrugata TaxID=47879 RepID=UPI002859A705|nr:SagB/ThcOx family dehydrogenase [Pseudomonas corrugata]MDR7282690.1 SagB-type dehydrogenase family enzyme [Pseudomonas corrugata]
MKKLPHDYYLRFIDPLAYDQTIQFHAKGNFTIHEAFKNSAALHFINVSNLDELTGNELRIYPDMELCFPLKIDKDVDSNLTRNESCEIFARRSIPFDTIEELINPLISANSNSHKRGYPSGGALYPIEVFICSLTHEQPWPCREKILHLLPQSRKFEVIQDSQNIDNLITAIFSASNTIGTPSIAIIYIAYLPKTFFKYRYRGYRMALMEAGSIYTLIDLQCKKLGLSNRLWSAYTDTMICKSIGLNPGLFLPMCVHLIGESA